LIECNQYSFNMQVSKMEHESQDQLVIALEGQFFESNISYLPAAYLP